MNRKVEIEIIIEYLKNELKRVIKDYDSLVAEAIVKTGKLIEIYQNELKNIKHNDKKT
jgi:hypothetical protein